MRLNGNSRLLDVAQVWFAALVQGRWHANEDGIRFLQARKIRSRAKMPAIDELLDLRLRNMLDIRPPRIQHVHFVGIGIESRHLVPRFRKTQRQRQPHVSASNDGDLELGAFEELRFPVSWHESRRTPKLFWDAQAARPYEMSRTNIAGSRRLQKTLSIRCFSSPARCDCLANRSNIVGTRRALQPAVQGATGIPHAVNGIEFRPRRLNSYVRPLRSLGVYNSYGGCALPHFAGPR